MTHSFIVSLSTKLQENLYFFLGSDSSKVVEVDNEDDSLVCVENRGGVKIFQMDKVFGPKSSQQQVYTCDNKEQLSCIKDWWPIVSAK